MLASLCAVALVLLPHSAATGLFNLQASTASELSTAIETLGDSNAKSCFRAALNDLEATCVRLSETHKRVLALRFLECHLMVSNRPPLRECAAEAGRQDTNSALACVSKLEPVHFQLFTSFVVHADVLCHHVAHALYQDRSEQAAKQLLGAATQASTNLANISTGLQDIIRDQEHVVRAQSVVVKSVTSTAEQLQEHHSRLKQSIRQLAGATDSAFSRLDGKLARIDTTLDHVLYLERTLSGFAGSFSQVLVYSGSLLALWVVTSDPRMAAARPGGLMATTVALLVERMVWSWASEQSAAVEAASGTTPPPDAFVVLFGVPLRALDAVFAVRLTYAAVLCTLVLWSGWSYRDHAKAALDRLDSIERWLSALFRREPAIEEEQAVVEALPSPDDAAEDVAGPGEDEADEAPSNTRKRSSSTRRQRRLRSS